uniref:Tyrosine decarboxylase n=1 Tax=Timema tahoe TaxID=61484 RepID=A0A7R9NVI1_9NEOP|nr:unnamed protein product [Timema tahoe]
MEISDFCTDRSRHPGIPFWQKEERNDAEEREGEGVPTQGGECEGGDAWMDLVSTPSSSQHQPYHHHHHRLLTNSSPSSWTSEELTGPRRGQAVLANSRRTYNRPALKSTQRSSLPSPSPSYSCIPRGTIRLHYRREDSLRLPMTAPGRRTPLASPPLDLLLRYNARHALEARLHQFIEEIEGCIYRECTRIFVENYFGKNLSTHDKDSNPNLPVIGSLLYRESDALDHVATQALIHPLLWRRMDVEDFREHGKEMVEYICEYLSTLEERRVTPSVEPGYLGKLLPQQAPQEPEDWATIMADVESKIMPGVTHWQHRRFHAYFPSGNSFPSILGDMLADAIGCIGFSWVRIFLEQSQEAASPACTELETIVLDWLGKAIGLPEEFLAFPKGSKGGGVIQTSASECVLVCMLAARAQAIKKLKQLHPSVEEGMLLSKLMAYCSKEAHSCVEKAAMICFVKLRILEPDEKCCLRGDTLRQAMEEDEAMGLTPFFVSTTLGTTSCCSFDNLPEVGPVCKSFPAVWLHVDGAYAGNAFICPELKPMLGGIEYADSFNTNSNKWLLVNFDCSTMWVRDRFRLTSALVVDPLYLQHGYSDAAIDYRHWGVPLSRRFRWALYTFNTCSSQQEVQLWFVLRSYGISGLQSYIRHHIRLAKRFEALVNRDRRFQVCNEVKLGLVCFRLKGSDELNQKLLSNINESGRLHMVPASVNEKYVIRFCAVAQNATEDDMLDRKKKEGLAYKRSFFVRMVSDPKIYNPKIAKSLASSRHRPRETEMDTEEFRVRGKEMVDYICDYMNGLGSRPVYPSIEPGFLTNLIPSQAPEEPEDWDAIMADVDSKIMQGVCHWQHPRFHAYFPSGNSYPSIIADMLSDAIGSIAFSWGSASECILVSMLAARYQAVKHLKRNNPMAEDSSFLPKLVAYCSTEAHSCVEKAANICLVRLHILEPDGDCTLRGETLREAMEEDEKKGLFPFFVSATVGTTSSCAFDNLKEMGTVCCQYPSVWFHADGAYAGNSFICPENRYLMNGIYYADSFNTNANKWLLVAFDCSCMWIKDRNKLTSALNVDPLYLQHKRSEQTIDYRHWGVPLSRRFRALKLWFVLRRYGIQGLQAYIRNHCRLAKRFEGLIRKDERFQVINDVKLGLVCFRLNGTDRLNQDLLANINTSGKLHIIPSMVKGQYIIRFCVTAEHAKDEDIEEFRVKGKEMVDYICEYMDGLGSRRVQPTVEPGYLRDIIPTEAPNEPEDWDDIMADVDTKIMKGVCHWQHPRFHAYFPSGNSYPSIIGDMLSDAIGSIAFSWVSKALALPEEFLASPPGSRGGGVIQGSASECILVSMLAARNQAIQYLKKDVPDAEESSFLPRLVAYCSTESHSCVEKAAMISLVKLRILEPDENCSLRGDTLLKAMEEDEANGLFPFFVSTTLGTTSSCAFDNLKEIGPVCRTYPSVWFHVDGAYAGNSFICPENRYLMNGIHYADSFNTNTNKWLLVAFDCSCLWIKDRNKLTSALNVDPLYLQHKRSEETIDYRHWGIPLSRRFRALKLWFVLRRYGIQGLQAYIRNHCRLAKRFEGLVRKDSRFEVINDMGLVCFRVNGTDRLNQELLANINASGKLHMIPSLVKCRYIIRFCVTAEHAKDEDIDHAWEVIQEFASDLLESMKIAEPPVKPLPDTTKPLSRKLTRRLSFTRSVSREVYRRSLSRSSLHDGATPINVLDDEENIVEDEDVFHSGLSLGSLSISGLPIVDEKDC